METKERTKGNGYIEERGEEGYERSRRIRRRDDSPIKP
jgi:hypothetical protein